MINKHNIKINKKLYQFINEEVLTGINVDTEFFWGEFS